MRKLLERFENSILILLGFLMYASCMAAFFLLFSIDNPEITDISRTAAVTLSTYVIFLFLLSCIYGRFDVGRRKEKQTVFSLTLATLLTDLVTYFELTIMKTNEANNNRFTPENVGILFITFLLQFCLIRFFVWLGNRFYFWIHEKEKCVIVTENSAERVEKALNDFEDKQRKL